LGAHNDFITYAAETGTIGLLAVFWFLGLLLYAGYKRWKTRRDEVELATLLTLWIPCVSLAARFFFGTHMFYSLGGMMNALYFGMLVTHYQSPSSTLENDG
jgi:O-antigen ligase